MKNLIGLWYMVAILGIYLLFWNMGSFDDLPTPVQEYQAVEKPDLQDVEFATGGSIRKVVIALPSEEEPTPVEEYLMLTAYLVGNPESPIQLLPSERAEKYLADEVSLLRWMETVPLLAPHVSDVVYDKALHEQWQLCREHQALRAFAHSYTEGERMRWELGQSSVSFEEALRPSLGFLREHYGDHEGLWVAINTYSSNVINELWREGEQAEDPGGTWELHAILTELGAPAFDAIVETLLGKINETDSLHPHGLRTGHHLFR